MSKYSNEFKLEVIKYYKKYGGLKRTAEFFHISSHELVRKWVNKYEKHGPEGLLKNFKSSYDGNFKQSVIEYMHKNHLSCAETSFCKSQYKIDKKIQNRIDKKIQCCISRNCKS